MIAILVIVITVVVALFILGGAAWFAWDSDKRVKKFARSTDLIPGKPGRAPVEWTSATSKEALLHQRVRYAIADVHANPAIPHDEDLVAARDRLDDAVFDLDDKLIATAEVADQEDRSARLEAAESAILVLEELPRKLWEAPKETQLADLEKVTSALVGA
ncbi:hypothetical protein [Gordonia sp. SL306]|uniref:hypothetical protein n=1 Tax=Gordonia sp. SL306 TaxID=2995145 RepID=UPI00227218F6|nr:hypothetical protein [Gordonia sp. SL306]WAC53607.1 hypothetical protein OVA31_12775 [Gordonia sp. SL306]